MNDTSDDEFDYFKFTIDEIQNSTDQFLISNNQKPYKIWRKFVQMMFDKIPNVTLALDKEEILMRTFDLNYLGEILNYLKKTEFVLIELLMWWTTVHAMIINTTSDIVDFIYKQYTPFNSDPVFKPRYGNFLCALFYKLINKFRSLACAELVNEFMGIAVSYGIADRMFMNKTKPKVNL